MESGGETEVRLDFLDSIVGSQALKLLKGDAFN